MTKYVFVTGGVVSGLGKGSLQLPWDGCSRAAASRSPSPSSILNQCRPGTMSPLQHGEVFVTDDGARPTSTSVTTSDLWTSTSLR